MFGDFIKTETITLQKIPIQVQEILNSDLLDSKVELWQDYAMYRIAMRVRGFVWGEESVKHIEISYPKDWKESFKERWFPEILKKRFPVEYTKHIIDVRVLYPDLKIAVPNERHALHLVQTTSPFVDTFKNWS